MADDPPITSAIALCTLDEVRIHAGGIRDHFSDDLINDHIALALTRLNELCGREFMWTAKNETRIFDVTSHRLNLAPYDLRNCTKVVMDPNGEATELTLNVDYILRPFRLTNTYVGIKLSDALYLGSDFTRRFGFAQVAVTGDWGIWQQLSAVALTVNEAAIDCVLDWIDKAVTDIADIDSSTARPMVPGGSLTYDVPGGAWRKLQPYMRSLGVY